MGIAGEIEKGADLPDILDLVTKGFVAGLLLGGGGKY